MSFKIKVKTFSDIQNLNKFIASKPVLLEILKQVIQTEGKWNQIEIGSKIWRKNTGKGNILVNKKGFFFFILKLF